MLGLKKIIIRATFSFVMVVVVIVSHDYRSYRSKEHNQSNIFGCIANLFNLKYLKNNNNFLLLEFL